MDSHFLRSVAFALASALALAALARAADSAAYCSAESSRVSGTEPDAMKTMSPKPATKAVIRIDRDIRLNSLSEMEVVTVSRAEARGSDTNSPIGDIRHNSNTS